ncbi:SH3 domain-containing protein [Brevibacterium casei]
MTDPVSKESDNVRYVLTADHEIPDRPPLTLEPGDSVEVGDQDTEWPAFVFVTAPRGTGWVPARHIDIDGPVGTVRVGYDTTELPASSGDYVDLVRDDPESGWSWCRNSDGREGWIPRRVLAVLE